MTSLTPKQQQAAILIASGQKCITAAKTVGVTPETISQWQKLPTFKAFCNEIRLELLDAIMDKVRGYAPQAVEEIADLMRFSKSDTIRLKAAETLLNHFNIESMQQHILYVGPTNPGSFKNNDKPTINVQEMVMDYMKMMHPNDTFTYSK